MRKLISIIIISIITIVIAILIFLTTTGIKTDNFNTLINEKLNEIKVGIRLIFQSPTRTLSEEDIQMTIGKILKPIIDLDGVIVPGLELN